MVFLHGSLGLMVCCVEAVPWMKATPAMRQGGPRLNFPHIPLPLQGPWVVREARLVVLAVKTQPWARQGARNLHGLSGWKWLNPHLDTPRAQNNSRDNSRSCRRLQFPEPSQIHREIECQRQLYQARCQCKGLAYSFQTLTNRVFFTTY